ncbi:MAG: 2-oxoacid:acceptor oxidoreductase family protein [Caldisericia bacterium]
MRKNFIFTGKGGQGIIFVATLLSQSAIIENLHSVQTQIYTAAQRGDISKSEVIISDEPIDYPKIENADFFISLTKKSLIKFKELIQENTTVLFDNTFEDLNEDFLTKNKIYKLPFTKISLDIFNKNEYTNIISLGFLIKLTDIIKEDSIIKTLEKMKKDLENNKKAFLLGINLYKKLLVEKEV